MTKTTVRLVRDVWTDETDQVLWYLPLVPLTAKLRGFLDPTSPLVFTLVWQQHCKQKLLRRQCTAAGFILTWSNTVAHSGPFGVRRETGLYHCALAIIWLSRFLASFNSYVSLELARFTQLCPERIRQTLLEFGASPFPPGPPIIPPLPVAPRLRFSERLVCVLVCVFYLSDEGFRN